jgi:type IV pili sensor histidine kinase/response regulator
MQGVSMKQGFFFGLIAVVLMVPTAWAQTRLVAGGDQVQVGRYTTQSAQPAAELAEPLSVYAQLNFPRQTVATVGQALDYTLIRTGYRMVDPEALSDHARSFLNLPLPESQRRMGPYSVRTLLQVLLGNAWTLRSDPISRQVWFELDGTETAPATPVAAVPEQTAQPSQPVPPQHSAANRDAQAMPSN